MFPIFSPITFSINSLLRVRIRSRLDLLNEDGEDLFEAAKPADVEAIGLSSKDFFSVGEEDTDSPRALKNSRFFVMADLEMSSKVVMLSILTPDAAATASLLALKAFLLPNSKVSAAFSAACLA